MATDIATLGIEIQSGNVAVATTRLNEFRRSAQNAATASDHLSSSLKKAELQSKNLASVASGLRGSMLSLSKAFAFSWSFKSLMDFEQSMASVKAVTRAVGSEFDTLRSKALELGASTRYTASQAAEAMRNLAQGGLSTDEILQSSQGVLALAQTGALNLADAAEISVKALRGFRLEASQMNHVADVVARTATMSATNVQEIGYAFTYVASISSSLNVSLEDTAAAIAALSNAGISSSMAGTALRGVMMRLMAPTQTTVKLLEAAGLKMSDLDIRTRGLVPVLKTLANANLGSKAYTIFGQRAGPAFEILKTSIGQIEKFQDILKSVDGYAVETGKIMDNNLKGAFLNLTSALESFVLRGAESGGVTAMLTNGMFGLAAAVRGITNIGTSGWFSAFVGALGGLSVALTASRLAATGFGAGLVTLGGDLLTAAKLAPLAAKQYGLLGGAFEVSKLASLGLVDAFRALASSPVFWLVAIGTAVAVVGKELVDASKEAERLDGVFESLNKTSEITSAELVNNAVSKVNEAFRAAEAAMKAAQDNLNQTLAKYSASSFNMDFSASHDVFVRTQSWQERMFGAEQATLDAVAAYRTAVAVISSESSTLEEKFAAWKTLNQEIRTLKEQNQSLSSLKEMGRVVADLYEQLEKLAKAQKGLDEATHATDRMNAKLGDAKTQASLLGDAISYLDEKASKLSLTDPDAEKDYGRLVKIVSEYTSGLDEAKKEAEEAKKTSVQAALEIMESYALAAEQAYALAQAQYIVALSSGTMSDAVSSGLAKSIADMTRLRGEYEKYRSRVDQVVQNVKPRTRDGDGGSNRTAEQSARFREAAATKIAELNLKIAETQENIIGLETTEIKVLKLQQASVAELSRLREQAARAGVSAEDAQLQEATHLTNKLYEMKIAWEENIGPIEEAIKIAEKLGDKSTETTLQMELLSRQVAEVQRSFAELGAEKSSLDFLKGSGVDVTEEMSSLEKRMGSARGQMEQLVATVFQYAYSNRFAEGAARDFYLANKGWMDAYGQGLEYTNALTSERSGIYKETVGKAIELSAAMQAVKESYDDNTYSLDIYTEKMAQLNVQMAELKLEMGDASFAQGMIAALGKVTKSYEGMAKGVSEAWGDFFVGFSQGFADAVADALVYGESLDETLNSLLDKLTKEFISALINLGVQWAITKVLGSTLAKEAAAENVAIAASSGASIAAAYAPAATMVSLATFGANSGPAIAGMIAAQTASQMLQFMPGFADGGYTGDMSRGSIAGVVHGGEYVMDAATVSRYGVGFFDALRTGGLDTHPTGVVPALPGGSDAVRNITVNVFNETDVPAQAESEVQMDGNGNLSLDIMLKQIDQGMAGLARSGKSAYAKWSEKAYGLSRAGVLARSRQ